MALDKAKKASALMPSEPSILITLGAAQYRLGFYENALKTLAKCAKLLSDEEETDPANVAFTAMTLHRIGRMEEAKAALGQLRELCKQEHFTWDMDVQGLLAEAEKVFADEKQ